MSAALGPFAPKIGAAVGLPGSASIAFRATFMWMYQPGIGLTSPHWTNSSAHHMRHAHPFRVFGIGAGESDQEKLFGRAPIRDKAFAKGVGPVDPGGWLG